MDKSKLSSIETLVSQTLVDMKISHEEFNTILKEKKREDERKCEEFKRKTRKNETKKYKFKDLKTNCVKNTHKFVHLFQIKVLK